MTDLALITDHSAEALALLIDQYTGLPRLTGLLASWTNRVQELENITWDVTNKRLIDYVALDGTSASARAEQLEALGRLVGRGRAGQSDTTYLVYIRAQIAINRSHSKRDDILSLITLIESSPFIFTEFYPASVYLEFSTTPVTSPALLLPLAQLVAAGGVHVYLISEAQTDGFLLGDDTTGGTVDSVHGFSSEALTDGGYLAGILG